MCILGSSGISKSLDPVLIPKSFLSAGDAANTTLPCLSVFPTTARYHVKGLSPIVIADTEA